MPAMIRRRNTEQAILLVEFTHRRSPFEFAQEARHCLLVSSYWASPMVVASTRRPVGSNAMYSNRTWAVLMRKGSKESAVCWFAYPRYLTRLCFLVCGLDGAEEAVICSNAA